ncbi:hypothetical protein CCUS01_10062 [Colletotrichum cuscutae]|uniref:Uncharacterized protein n=1 Tax=Colletotrichum cuscutae TaxID=1209917 RepID=A0AAI9UFG1_9PEZI|nr:hypothetical protein CCUS01_10062 [Colletotrichum cuscutae]
MFGTNLETFAKKRGRSEQALRRSGRSDGGANDYQGVAETDLYKGLGRREDKTKAEETVKPNILASRARPVEARKGRLREFGTTGEIAGSRSLYGSHKVVTRIAPVCGKGVYRSCTNGYRQSWLSSRVGYLGRKRYGPAVWQVAETGNETFKPWGVAEEHRQLVKNGRERGMRMATEISTQGTNAGLRGETTLGEYLLYLKFRPEVRVPAKQRWTGGYLTLPCLAMIDHSFPNMKLKMGKVGRFGYLVARNVTGDGKMDGHLHLLYLDFKVPSTTRPRNTLINTCHSRITLSLFPSLISSAFFFLSSWLLRVDLRNARGVPGEKEAICRYCDGQPQPDGKREREKKKEKKKKQTNQDALRTPSQAGCASSPLDLATLWLPGYPRQAYLLLKARDMDDEDAFYTTKERSRYSSGGPGKEKIEYVRAPVVAMALIQVQPVAMEGGTPLFNFIISTLDAIYNAKLEWGGSQRLYKGATDTCYVPIVGVTYVTVHCLGVQKILRNKHQLLAARMARFGFDGLDDTPFAINDATVVRFHADCKPHSTGTRLQQQGTRATSLGVGKALQQSNARHDRSHLDAHASAALRERASKCDGVGTAYSNPRDDDGWVALLGVVARLRALNRAVKLSGVRFDSCARIAPMRSMFEGLRLNKSIGAAASRFARPTSFDLKELRRIAGEVLSCTPVGSESRMRKVPKMTTQDTLPIGRPYPCFTVESMAWQQRICSELASTAGALRSRLGRFRYVPITEARHMQTTSIGSERWRAPIRDWGAGGKGKDTRHINMILCVLSLRDGESLIRDGRLQYWDFAGCACIYGANGTGDPQPLTPMAGTTYITSMSGISMWNLWVFDWYEPLRKARLTAARRGGGGEDLALGKAFPTSRWFSTLSRLNVTSPPGPALLHHRDSSETAGKDNKTRPGKMRATSVNFAQLAEFLPFTAQPNCGNENAANLGKNLLFVFVFRTVISVRQSIFFLLLHVFLTPPPPSPSVNQGLIRNTPSSQQGNTSIAYPTCLIPIPPVTILHPADPSFNLPSSPRLPPDFETFRCPIDRTNIFYEYDVYLSHLWSLHWAEHLQDPLEPFSTKTMCSSFSYQNAVKHHREVGVDLELPSLQRQNPELDKLRVFHSSTSTIFCSDLYVAV